MTVFTSALTAACAALVGYVGWGLVEYGIHGLLSHRFRTFVTPMHWGHHKTPAAVFTSPVAWVPIALLLWIAAAGLVGAGLASAFSAGLLGGFARYEWLHWRIHFRTPRSERERVLRAHHLAHHFVNPRMYHGVTTQRWDRAFGTLPGERERERDYARVANHPPIAGPSNLGLVFNPRASLRIVVSNLRRGPS